MVRWLAIIIQSALDIILPRKDRILRIDHYTTEDIPVSPVEHDMLNTRIVTLLNYRDQVVEDLIQALKYDRSEHAARLLASALAEYLREEIVTHRAFSTQQVVLVPVPLHASRQRERGFNQIERVLRALPEEFQNGTLSRIDTTSLVRVRATRQQTRLSRTERLQNVRGAFMLTAPLDAHVLLIDDVTTTGATLTEATRSLNTTTISLLALAHA